MLQIYFHETIVVRHTCNKQIWDSFLKSTHNVNQKCKKLNFTLQTAMPELQSPVSVTTGLL